MQMPKFHSIEDRPGWQRADGCGDSEAVEELAMRLNASRPAHTYFVCGFLPDDSQHMLYRIETRDPLDIVREFEVGSHAELSYGENALPTVLEEMTLVHARNPIVPFFADAAGLKCTFERLLTEEFGEFLDSTITEGIEVYGDAGCIGPVVMEEGFLHLWWD